MLRVPSASVLFGGLAILLGVALAVLPLKWTVLLLAGGIVLILLLIRPQVALCLLAFAVPFGSIRELSLGPVSVGGAELLIALLLSIWFAQMVVRRRIQVPRAPLLLPLSIFIAVLLLSLLPAQSLELSAKEIIKWVEVAILYGFMADALDERWGRWVVWSLLAAGSAEALVGIYQFLWRVGPEGFVLFGRFMRAYGHFAQPNPFAGYLGLGLPLAFALTLQSLPRQHSNPPAVREADKVSGAASALQRVEQLLLRAMPVAAFGIMALAMIMSWSRGSWVGLVAALLVVTAARSRTALVTAVAIGLIVAYFLLAGGAQYLPPTLVQRVSDFLPFVGTPYPLLGVGDVDVASVEVNDANWAVIERMAHWQAAIGMFTDHPWLGVGIGNYAVAYPQYAVGRWRDPLGHAHNYYLNIAAEAGIIGLGAYLLLFGACFAVAWRTIQRTQGYWRAVALGGLGILVHLSVHNLFDNLFVHSMNVQLGLVLGLLFLAERYGAGRPTPDGIVANAHRD
jgi:putative inorganic carbon (HCO3(-)) transporter